MRGTVTRGGAAMLLLGSLVLTGCTEHVKKRCSGSGGEVSCTVSYKTSDGRWDTELDADEYSDEMTISGTFTVESGSGTLILEGDDASQEFPISAEEPVVVEGLTLPVIERDDETWVNLRVIADPQIDGFSGEYTFQHD